MSGPAVTAQGSQTINGSGAVLTTLLSQAVYAALKPVFNSKIYPQIAPDLIVAPYGIYSSPATAPELTLNDGSPIANDHYQVDVYAASYDEAHRLAAAAAAAMLAIPYPISVVFVTQSDAFEPEVKLHRVIQDFSIWNPRSNAP